MKQEPIHLDYDCVNGYVRIGCYKVMLCDGVLCNVCYVLHEIVTEFPLKVTIIKAVSLCHHSAACAHASE